MLRDVLSRSIIYAYEKQTHLSSSSHNQSIGQIKISVVSQTLHFSSFAMASEVIESEANFLDEYHDALSNFLAAL